MAMEAAPKITTPATIIEARHIQNFSDASTLQPHWGYAERVLPCTNDPGSCEYLDVVYRSHDLGMIYSGILWATIAGILVIWAMGRKLFASPRVDETKGGETPAPASRGSIERIKRTIAVAKQRYLLPDAIRPMFGRVSRLQVLILAILVGYLTIWSFVGIVYKTWITPVKNMDGVYNTRTSLGPWSDRVGVLAYALTPLSILLATRESVLSVLTGISYQHFNFLHRWLGYIIWAQSILHTIGWTIIEVKLYQPQPDVATKWIKQLYMIWGVIAIILLTFLFVLSLPPVIKLTGYEFFRKAHYVLAMVYIGAAIGHWENLQCFLIPAIGIWGIDRVIRLARTAMIHYQLLPEGGRGFKSIDAVLSLFPDCETGDDVIRLDFTHIQKPWHVGQHFYITFLEGSIWQAHPFTPLNLPVQEGNSVKHAYIFRAKSGETRRILEKVKSKTDTTLTTPVILTGPYGANIAANLFSNVNVLAVAGGTGITFVLPVLLYLARQSSASGRKIQLVWVIRHRKEMDWIRPELDALTSTKNDSIEVKLFVTRDRQEKLEEGKAEKTICEIKDTESTSSAPASEQKVSIQNLARLDNRHPDMSELMLNFMQSTVRGPTNVYASGPGAMVSSLRDIVAAYNDPSQVIRGDEKHDVRFINDDRLEW